jgi:leucyl-tRNA synthetase
VDLYIGGTNMQPDIYCILVLEQILKDKGFAPTEEPFKKLINQGMILGTSAFVYRVMVGGNPDKFGRNKLPKVFISKILMKIL